MRNFMKTIVNAIQHWTKEKIKESTADWNQNDPTAPDYVKNRLAWTDDPVETVLLEETELTFVDGGAELPTPIQLTEGQTYVVTYNGNTYDCTAWLWEVEGVVFIGNGGVLGVSAGNYEPFITDGAVMESINADASATIRIIQAAAEVHKIDEKYLPKQTQYFTPSTSEPNQLWFIGKSFAPSTDVEEVDLGSNSYRWNKLFLGGSTYSGIDTGSNLITRSELNCLSGINTNIQDAIDNLNTIGNQFTLYTDENRLAFTGQNFTPLNTSKLSNLGDNYNYWNYIFLQGGIYTPNGLIEARNIDQLANLQENVQNKLILLTQGYNELANKIENGTGGGSSSTTAPKVMSIFKPFDTASSTLPYNVAYGQIGFDETSLTPWVYAPYYTYYVTWNGKYLQQTGENMETVNSSTMPDMLSRGYNYLVDDSTDSVYSVFSPGSTSNTMPNTGTLPNTGTVGTIATGEEMSGDLSIYYDAATNYRWYPTSGWDTSFLQPSVTYKLCIMEWQPFLQPAESSLF